MNTSKRRGGKKSERGEERTKDNDRKSVKCAIKKKEEEERVCVGRHSLTYECGEIVIKNCVRGKIDAV